MFAQKTRDPWKIIFFSATFQFYQKKGPKKSKKAKKAMKCLVLLRKSCLAE
jgi:hypothetical protein